jgi:hypothetical protein
MQETGSYLSSSSSSDEEEEALGMSLPMQGARQQLKGQTQSSMLSSDDEEEGSSRP